MVLFSNYSNLKQISQLTEYLTILLYLAEVQRTQSQTYRGGRHTPQYPHHSRYLDNSHSMFNTFTGNNSFIV